MPRRLRGQSADRRNDATRVRARTFLIAARPGSRHTRSTLQPTARRVHRHIELRICRNAASACKRTPREGAANRRTLVWVGLGALALAASGSGCGSDEGAASAADVCARAEAAPIAVASLRMDEGGGGCTVAEDGSLMASLSRPIYLDGVASRVGSRSTPRTRANRRSAPTPRVSIRFSSQ